MRVGEFFILESFLSIIIIIIIISVIVIFVILCSFFEIQEEINEEDVRLMEAFISKQQKNTCKPHCPKNKRKGCFCCFRQYLTAFYFPLGFVIFNFGVLSVFSMLLSLLGDFISHSCVCDIFVCRKSTRSKIG